MKFHDLLAETLYEDLIAGFCDDMQGDIDDNGKSYALFTQFDNGEAELINVILVEDAEGYVFADCYPSKEAVEQAWDEVTQEVEEFYGRDALDITEDND